MTVKNPRATKKFKGLVALLEDEDRAVIAWNASNPDNLIPVADTTEPSAEVAKLMKAGFKREEAETALAAAATTDTTAAPETVEAPLTSSEQGEVLAAKAGLIPVRGRVYSHPALIEAQARVLKTGTPELVQQPGEHRTKAVLVYRLDDGKGLALQNHGVQN
jgi:hypothetical protein